MAVPAAIQHPHFLHFLCLTWWSVIIPVVLGDAAETAAANETASIAKVAIAPGGGNVGVARVHPFDLFCLVLLLSLSVLEMT